MILGNGIMEDDLQNGDSNMRNFQDIEQIPDNQQELLAEFERRRRVFKLLNKNYSIYFLKIKTLRQDKSTYQPMMLKSKQIYAN